MKICPTCFLEFNPEQTQCPDCKEPLVEADQFSIETSWPHCKKCQTIAYENDTRCSECGHPFHIIPFMPNISALLVAALAFFLVAFTLDRLGMSDTTLKVAGMVTAGLTWTVMRGRINMQEAPAQVPWERISQKTKDGLRENYKAGK